jgi:hypothetical protein
MVMKFTKASIPWKLPERAVDGIADDTWGFGAAVLGRVLKFRITGCLQATPETLYPFPIAYSG